MNRVFFIGLMMFSFLWSGCVSKPKFKGNGDLCGFVIDEDNLPVENYIISVKHGAGVWKTTVTNKQGMFYFSDSALGEYTFKGTKNCYVNLLEKKYLFSDKSKIFCFQIDSVDEALNKVEEMIICEDFENALKLLDEINCERKTEVKRIITIYKEYLKKQIKLKKEKSKNEK